jgi:hypothetical protein
MAADTEDVRNLISRLQVYLTKNPGSSARQIKTGLKISNKREVNSCLYTYVDVHFRKQGDSPPLWWNKGEPTNAVEQIESSNSNDMDFSNFVESVPTEFEALDADTHVVEEEPDAAHRTNDVSLRFSVCGKCGQIIGSKGICGC